MQVEVEDALRCGGSGAVHDVNSVRSEASAATLARRCASSMTAARSSGVVSRGLEPAKPAQMSQVSSHDQRAGEYDDWYESRGLFVERDRPGWAAEVDQLVTLVSELSPARTLDVACGSGFLTRHLRGFVVGLDQSRAMVEVAQARLPEGLTLVGDALNLVFADHAFGRVFTGHFYGHLPPDERTVFLGESRRVAAELVVVDSALRPGVEPEGWNERVLTDGSHHRVYKRYLSGEQLACEIGGDVLLEGRWFVAARTTWLPDG